MYVYLENNLLIPSKEIIIIIDYIHFMSEKNTKFYREELKKKELVDLTEKERKTVIITDNKIYISSYGKQTLMSRSNEFFNIIGGRK
ncbi:Uncharacterised protein [Fusobacterium necrogenes]|uniref:DUF370 domain-containing protein n=1 Tax=Fusobacterium necrogenes TaxID=858 RepID=A0A377GZ22_9FUSO|nr:extracellular matrix/biofilm biosynthesis regulator RemA family protein [Fusobacterium necrogenes]STO32240.1 Uncharacterised protein [Fusobacterium necrogenes]